MELKIDKRVGYWSKTGTMLDDVAYSLLVKHVKKNKDDLDRPSQWWFIKNKKDYMKFYNKAQIKLRKIKINEIKQRNRILEL